MITMSKPTQLYEINTAVYLARLSRDAGRQLTLAEIPDEALSDLTTRGIDAVWLMGVWQRSPRAIEIACADEQLMAEMHSVLPDMTNDDLIGSAYSIHDYIVDERFGGESALITFCEQLKRHGLRLILDFVPNHTALDHPWIQMHPDYYIHGSPADLAAHPESFVRCDEHIVANGRDPNYPAWQDTAQVDAYSAGYRQTSIDTLRRIAQLCDGVRCDMAMLMMNDVFSDTWQRDDIPSTEYWVDVISAVRQQSPEFIFIAEAYWHRESALVEQGFDYCYDKTLYDLLVEGSSTHHYLDTHPGMIEHGVHFIENHDEQRAAAVFALPEHTAAAQLIASLPGLTMWHDGQWQGYRTRIPMQLGRGPQENPDPTIVSMYDALLLDRHEC
jgi:hypothetical protein